MVQRDRRVVATGEENGIAALNDGFSVHTRVSLSLYLPRAPEARRFARSQVRAPGYARERLGETCLIFSLAISRPLFLPLRPSSSLARQEHRPLSP